MSKENISRKEAIKKMGKYAALTALGTMIMLEPAKAQRCSPPASRDRSFGVRRNKRQTMFKK